MSAGDILALEGVMQIADMWNEMRGWTVHTTRHRSSAWHLLERLVQPEGLLMVLGGAWGHELYLYARTEEGRVQPPCNVWVGNNGPFHFATLQCHLQANDFEWTGTSLEGHLTKTT